MSRVNEQLAKIIKDNQVSIILATVVIGSQLSYAKRLEQGDDTVGDTVGAIETAQKALYQRLASEAVAAVYRNGDISEPMVPLSVLKELFNVDTEAK